MSLVRLTNAGNSICVVFFFEYARDQLLPPNLLLFGSLFTDLLIPICLYKLDTVANNKLHVEVVCTTLDE